MTANKMLLMLWLFVFWLAVSGCGDRRILEVEPSSVTTTQVPYEMPNLSVQGVTGEAGHPVRFFVMLNKPARSVVRVQLSTVSDTALEIKDFAPYAAELTLAPGETVAEIEVSTFISPIDRGPLQFYLEASEIVGATIWKSRGMALITPAP